MVLKELKEFLEYSMTQQGLTMTMTAKELKAGKVKGGLFVIPDDYELKTSEELAECLDSKIFINNPV